MTLSDLLYHIRGAAMEVYNTLGPGLLESVYHKALACEIANRGLKVESEVPVAVYYKGCLIEGGFRLDLLVEDEVIIELKSVEEIMPIHFKQLKTYMKLSGKENGVLINFNTYDLSHGIRLVKLRLTKK